MNRGRVLLILIFMLAAAAAPDPALAQAIGAVTYLGQYTPPSGGGYTAGCWGWTDTASGREYAILGNQCGTAFVEITDVGAMAERDFVPGPCSTWREIQVHGHYAYVVSEAGSGTQIIDMSYLPDSVHHVRDFVHSSGFKSTVFAHSIQIRDGYMYLNGCANWSPGGIVIFDLADPENPVYKGEYAGVYIHDCFVRNDTIYGAAINGQGIKIIDATNKNSPTLIRTINYTGSGTHNTATTPDGSYVLSTDEIGSTAKTLKIWDLSNDSMVAEYAGSPTAIVHNVFVRESLAIMSYYTAGMRVVDISDPASPVEIGGYDTRPGDESADYDGAWSVYPFFPSGKIIIGDMGFGMYVVEVRTNAPNPPDPFSAYSDYATPTSVTLNWTDPTTLGGGGPLSNFRLHLYRGPTYIAEVDSGVETYTDTGLTEHAYYLYSIRAVGPSDSGNAVTTGVYAGGHAQPEPPTSFQVNDIAGANRLTWINPARQLDDTPLNDLAFALIYRDGALYDSIPLTSADTAQAELFDDPGPGFHTYYVAVRDNETPAHASTVSASGSGFGGLRTDFTETFEATSAPYEITGPWDTTSSIAAGGSRSFTDSPFGTYSPNSTPSVTFPRVVLDDAPILRFRHIALVAFGDIAWLQISRDNRKTWTTLKVYNVLGHPLWQDSTADPGDWETQLFDLNAYAHDSVNVRFRIVTNPTTELDGWYLDDLYLGTSHEPVAVEQEAAAGWNIVSLPVLVDDGSTGTLFPGSVTQAYSYDGAYIARDTLEAGKGYWLKFDSAATFNYGGYAILRDTIPLSAGWNLVGTLGGAIAASGVSTTPAGIIGTPFYAYSGGYATSPTLEPGKGYWVKAQASGSLILSLFAAKASAGEESESATGPAAQPPAGTPEGRGILTFTDAAGRTAALTLVAGPAPGLLTSAFELPPVPPSGAFDVRFGSQRSLEVLAPDAMAPVLSQGLVGPVRVSWSSGDGSAVRFGADGTTGRIGDGGTVVFDAAPGRFSVGLDGRTGPGVPACYSLAQNYPNPFNPSTTIPFSLAAAGRVRLEIFTTLGQKVATLVDEVLGAGTYSRTWEARGGVELPAGVYHARLTVHAGGEETYTASRKLLLLR